MASSGTVTNPVIEFRLKPKEKQSVVLVGRVQIKSSALIEAGDLTLRTIKSAVVSGGSGWTGKPGAPPVAYGSVIVAGSLMNSVSMRSWRGSIVPHTGTQHIGTTVGGTMQVNFFIHGA